MKVFIEETDYANLSTLSSFLLHTQEKGSEGTLGRKSYCIMIRGKFRTLSSISHGPFMQKSQQLPIFAKN